MRQKNVRRYNKTIQSVKSGLEWLGIYQTKVKEDVVYIQHPLVLFVYASILCRGTRREDWVQKSSFVTRRCTTVHREEANEDRESKPKASKQLHKNNTKQKRGAMLKTQHLLLFSFMPQYSDEVLGERIGRRNRRLTSDNRTTVR